MPANNGEGKECKLSKREGDCNDSLVISYDNNDNHSNKDMIMIPQTDDEEGISSNLPPLDGKRAWIVLAGLVLIACLINLHLSWGVMQNYYMEEKVFSEGNQVMRLTFVATLFDVFFRLCNLLGNILYTLIGFRLVLILGICLIIGGLVISSLIWQLYLTYSLCCGTGASIIILVGNQNVTTAAAGGDTVYRILPQWFSSKRLSTANGIFSGLSGIGGIVIAPLSSSINASLGSAWTYKVTAFVIFACAVVGFPCIAERKVSVLSEGSGNKKEKKKTIFHNSFGFGLLKNANLVIWIIICPIYLCVVGLIMTFIPPSANAISLSDMEGAFAITVVSISAIVGSVVVGILADKFGNINVYIISSLIAAMSVSLLWILTRSIAGFMAFSVIQGFVISGYFAVSTSVLISIVGIERYPGGLRSIASTFSILGPFLATYLDTLNTGMEPYFYCKIVAGSGYMVCALLATIVKLRMNSKLIAKI
ncbi:major facilitator superfamily domain-containing protein [Phascolomyces articulosus]|uniref:Major facilitator superfamily domain-containing protein n=1 Tax=Phascolomyces articulosus TaxID=60185 RepID=A0AAD5KPF1_9FUNG|nr:major facilitator superfamily domain-containing protein [Phascolomyces articulosus]